VDSGTQMDVKKRIHDASEMTTDPAGREVLILKDEQALRIAGECDCKAHDVYTMALKEGICPYRYIRNRESISLEEQLRMAEFRVAIVGAGGLGGNVILLLARLGIGYLVVVDQDVFDETNLNRQALCSQRSLGKPKCEEAVLAVGSINPGTQVFPHRLKLDRSNAVETLAGCDLVVDALDNVQDRLVLEEAAKELGIPFVHGALAGFEGQLMTIFPGDPGLKQLYGNEGSDLDRSKRPEAVLGVPALMPSLVATFQSMEALKIILGRGKTFRKAMVHVDLETGQMDKFSFE